MASGFLRVGLISRAKGRSATAAAAYRSGSEIVDTRTGEIHDYERKRGVISSDIVLPEGEQPLSRSELWNMAEVAETRTVKATVARELVVGLSKELSAEERRDCILKLAEEVAATHKCGIEVSIHEPRRLSKSEIDALDDPLSHDSYDESGWPTNGNHHAHVLMTTRRVENGELGAKTREWDDLRGRVECKDKWTDRWCEIQNELFIKKGWDIRAVRGEGDEIHIGPEKAQLKRDEADKQLNVRSLNHEFFIAKQKAEKPTAGEVEKLEYQKSRFYVENPAAALRELLEIKREREQEKQQKISPAVMPSLAEYRQQEADRKAAALKKEKDESLAKLLAMREERIANKKQEAPEPEKTALQKLIAERERREAVAADERLAALRELYVTEMPKAEDLRDAVIANKLEKELTDKKEDLRGDLILLGRHPDWPEAIEKTWVNAKRIDGNDEQHQARMDKLFEHDERVVEEERLRREAEERERLEKEQRERDDFDFSR